MNKRLAYIVAWILIIVSTNLNAQDVEFKASNFKDQKEGFKLASDNLKTGDQYFEKAKSAITKADVEESYKRALEFYKKAHDFNPDNAALNYKTGKCIFETADKLKSIPYLTKSINLNAEVDPDAYFTLGQALTSSPPSAQHHHTKHLNYRPNP